MGLLGLEITLEQWLTDFVVLALNSGFIKASNNVNTKGFQCEIQEFDLLCYDALSNQSGRRNRNASNQMTGSTCEDPRVNEQQKATSLVKQTGFLEGCQPRVHCQASSLEVQHSNVLPVPSCLPSTVRAR